MAERKMEVGEPQEANKVPSKISFSVAKFSSRARVYGKSDRGDEEAEHVEFVSEFDGLGRRPSQEHIRVIPLQENSWRPEKRMKNIMVASEFLPSTDVRFESEILSAGPQPSVQYGLQLQKKPSDPAEAEDLDAKVNGHLSSQDHELQKFREDVKALPDETSLDAYENVPVEAFAAALLRGMGWEEGKPIGRNAKELVAPCEPARRVGREGLGAIPAPQPEKVKKLVKPGESRKTKLTVGRIMCIVAGKHNGLRAQIAQVNDDSYTVALLEGGERMDVKPDALAEVASLEAEKAMKKSTKTKDSDMMQHHSEEVSDRYKSRSRKRDDGDSKRGEHFPGKETKASMREGAVESRHKKHGMSSRRDRQAESYKHNKGRQDAVDKHESRKEGKGSDVYDEQECYEAMSQHSHGRGRSSEASESRYELRDGDKKKSERFGSHNKQEVVDSVRWGHSSDSLHKEKNRSCEHNDERKNVAVKKEVQDGLTAGSNSRGMRSWLARDIRVRIIHKRAYGEKLYLKKACVVDVVSPSICDIQMDEDGKLIQQVKQEHLETALPNRGGRVLVVEGKHRGQTGILQERLSEKGIALVQMEDNYEVLSFDLDNLAEFVGGFHEMED